MSTKSEVDLFEDIEEPQKDFWATLLNKESQKSTTTLEEKSSFKKETDSETSEDDDDEIVIVKEIQVNPPDLILQSESGEIDVHSQIYSQNPITNVSLYEDKPLHPDLHKRVLKFRKNYNVHLLFATWGQIDQLVMRKQRLMRLMALGNMIQNTNISKESFLRVHQEYYRLNGQINVMMKEIQQEHKFIIANTI